MKTTKTFKLVMLPTEKASKLHLSKSGILISSREDIIPTDTCSNPQHLYIISDEEIKEGDWYLVELFNVEGYSNGYHIEQCGSIVDIWVNNKEVNTTRHISNCRKIVATTDKSLRLTEIIKEDVNIEFPYITPLPEIPESFIKAYIKAYNSGSPITEVQLEIEYYDNGNSMMDSNIISERIKTRPDNTVIIHQSKMYSRDEVEKLCKNAWLFSDADSIIQNCCGQVDTAEPLIEKSFNKWKDKNL